MPNGNIPRLIEEGSFFCYFRNEDTYSPYNTLTAKMCETQCIRCEQYQEGSNDFNPRHLPVREVDNPDAVFIVAYIDCLIASMS